MQVGLEGNLRNQAVDDQLTLAIGSASYDPGGEIPVDAVINEADSRMYEDKNNR